MAHQRYSNKWILAKAETSYGANSNPIAADGVRAVNLSREPYGGTIVERMYDRNAMGNYEQINASPMASVSFEVDLCGAPTAAGSPGYGALLQACGFVEADAAAESDPTNWADSQSYSIGDKVTRSNEAYVCIQAHTSSNSNAPDASNNGGDDYWDEYEKRPASKTYMPVEAIATSSVTIAYYTGPQRQIITGCRGNVQFQFNKGQLPKAVFNFTGLYNRPVTAQAVAGTVTNYISALPVNITNTGLWRFAGASGQQLSALTIDIGNTVTHRNLVNMNQVYITDRKPTITCSVGGVDIADYDYFTRVESHSGGDAKNEIILRHGPIDGRMIEVTSDGVQLSSINEVDGEGMLEYSLEGILVPDGDNELTIAYC